MSEILRWISEYPGIAFVTGLFVLALAGFALALISKFFDFISDCICSVTGKWPAPRPVVECGGDCDCAKPCKCCEDNGCQVSCGCSSLIPEEE